MRRDEGLLGRCRKIRIKDLHRHEGGMSSGPPQRLPLCLEETVDDDRTFFGGVSPGQARGSSAFYGRASVDGGERFPVRQDYAASVGDTPRVDCAMSSA